MELELTLRLTSDDAVRAARIACRDAGHDDATCPDVQEHASAYAMVMLGKHVEMSERQIAEEDARAGLIPFGGTNTDSPAS